MIETAFECRAMGIFNQYDYFVEKKRKISEECVAFGRIFGTDKSRLIAILKNIIKNKGKFIPEFI